MRELRQAARRIQLYRAHTYNVSRALWPARMRRCIATTRAAQRRRMIIMKGMWWLRAAHAPLLYMLFGALASALLIGSVIMAALLMHYWAMLLIFGVLWLAMIVVTARLLSYEMSHSTAPVPSLYPVRHTQPGLPVAPMLEFPETPVPATPLIRVLETIDLSASDVEHFLGTPPPSQPSPAPKSEAGLPVDAPMPEEKI
jgi:hypothetical protein